MTRAAEELHITQPALSSSISRLEKEMGLVLFTRGNLGLTLTEAGCLLLPYAEAICNNYYAMQSEIQSYKQQARPLRVASGMQHVATIVNDYLHEYPHIQLTMQQYFNYSEIKQALLNRDVDIVVCAPPVTGNGIKTRICNNEPFCAVMSKHHQLAGKENLTLDELSIQNLIGHPPDTPLRVAIAQQARELNIELNYTIQAENNAILDLLQSSHSSSYIAIYPMYRAKTICRENPSLKIVPISNSQFQRTIAISVIENALLPPATRSFIKFVSNWYTHFLSDEQ